MRDYYLRNPAAFRRSGLKEPRQLPDLMPSGTWSQPEALFAVACLVVAISELVFIIVVTS